MSKETIIVLPDGSKYELTPKGIKFAEDLENFFAKLGIPAGNGNDSGATGNYDGISIIVAVGNLILGNQSWDNGGWGIMVGNASDYNKVSNNYTENNTAGSIRVNNAACDNNQIEFNTVEEGAPSDAGTLTRSYGNYDPSTNTFVGDVGAAPF